ncbi:MAG: hypothetical protein NTY76_07735 [Candidatus Omnitrophica bacterium]|nr:hypothetical protein [Candidatus Omnitrophota bacterium]
MKKSLFALFAALLVSSLCFAEQAPVAAPGDQTKTVETKKQNAVKKSVKPRVKKSVSKVQKTDKVDNTVKK